MEISIPGVDLPDSVLTHEDGCVSVVQVGADDEH
jgi:hypothetical protein